MRLCGIYLTGDARHAVLQILVVANVAGGKEVEVSVADNKSARGGIFSLALSGIDIYNLAVLPNIAVGTDIFDSECWVCIGIVAHSKLIYSTQLELRGFKTLF